MKIIQVVLQSGKEFKFRVPDEHVNEIVSTLHLGGMVSFNNIKLWIKHGAIDVLTIEDEPENPSPEKPKSKKK